MSAVLLALGLATAAGCGRPDGVVVYTVQDRVFAEPLLRQAEQATGVRVVAVYDNEANKGAALAQRLRAEAREPRADLWWSNEEMRTRQLVRAGALEEQVWRFGLRRRVLVTRTGDTLPVPPGSLAALTNASLRGQVSIAYPLFGTTTAHLLVLRERWGEPAWIAWCEALVANRPLLADGNSRVVRAVAAGQVRLGLTDSDDVRFARREGEEVVAHALPEAEDLVIPNTLAITRGARHASEARRVADWLSGPDVLRSLVEAGASEPVEGVLPGGNENWNPLLEGFEPSVERLGSWFVR